MLKKADGFRNFFWILQEFYCRLWHNSDKRSWWIAKTPTASGILQRILVGIPLTKTAGFTYEGQEISEWKYESSHFPNMNENFLNILLGILIACKSDLAKLPKCWFSVKIFTEKLESCQLGLGRFLGIFSMIWCPRWPSRTFSRTQPSSIDNYEYK